MVIVCTMNHVTTSLGSALMVVRTGILEHVVITYAVKDSTAETVLVFVLLTARRVDTRTDCVLVKQDGWVQIVLQSVFGRLERIASIHVVDTVSTRNVTDSTEAVCLEIVH